MTEDLHERAVRMIFRDQVEGLGAGERAWLDAHLLVCPGCSDKAEALGRAVSSLRSLSVRVDPSLLAATRRRVRSRAAAIEEQRTRLAAVWMLTVFSVLWMAITGPLTWRAFEWIGGSLGWADGVWQSVFLLAWFLPAPAVSVALLALRGDRWRQLHG